MPKCFAQRAKDARMILLLRGLNLHTKMEHKMRKYVYTLNDFADFISKGMNESAAILSDEKKSPKEKKAAQGMWDLFSAAKAAVVLFNAQENSHKR